MNAEGTSGSTSKGGKQKIKILIKMNTTSKGGSKKGRKLKTLTAIKKKELCEYKRDNPSKSHETIAELFEISKSTVGDILRTKDKWLAIY
ncbi:7240_t:CDS:2 [Entrophospora sp. SA101]|nr:7240_t:CDS:2 [Entrophospora sp. SA101]